MAASSSQPRPRRRWWQRLARLVVIAALLLTVLYVTFPLWAPCGLIREYIRQDLEKKLGVAVGLRALSLSWSQGVVLEGLTIQSDESFGHAVLADVERLSTEYSPYNLLVHDRFEWMTLDRLRLFPRIDDKGNCNLAVLGRMPTSPETRRMLIRNASVDISLPWQDRPLRLEVSDLQVNGGRTTRLGSVTMSAGLAQGSSRPATAAASRPDVAPLSVQVAASPTDPYEAASAAVAFSNVDLAQLNLPRVPGSPLAKLSGRCSGSLTLQINRQAIVDGFRLDVTVLDLDAHPTSGLRLPVFDKAMVRANGTFDLSVAGGEGKVDIQSLSVRVPGLEIAGHATVLADIMEGNPEAIKSLDLKGVVYPDRLAALAGYQAPEGEPKVEGPVAVEVSAQHLGDQLTFRVQADATGSGVSQGGSPIKLAGRALKLSCRGVWDHTADQLVLEEAQLALGGNLFKADGKVSRPLQHLRRLDASRPLPEMAAELAALNLQGTAEIKDAPALLDLLPPFRETARSLTIQGPLGGQWSVRSTDAIRLQCSLRAPAGTAVSIQGIFDKPLPAALALDLSAVVDPTHADLRDVNADLTLEQPDAKTRRQVARASINRAKVTWRRVPEQPDLSVAGRFDAEKAEGLLACLKAGAAAEAKVSGSFDGQFDVAGWGDNWKGSVKVDLARLDAAWQDLFRKAVNEEAVITSELAWAKGVLRADADIDLGQTHLKATGHTEPDGFGACAELSGEIHDAAWALSLSPALASRLQGCQVRGPFTLKASGTRGDRIQEGTLDIVADDVQCRFAGPVERVKPAGVPLRLSAAGRITLHNALQPPRLEVQKLDVHVGSSELHARGEVPDEAH